MPAWFDEMCDSFLKPQRQTYSAHDLGPNVVQPNAIRHDFAVDSPRGHLLPTSLYQLQSDNSTSSLCVIYLHSLNGSRIQALAHAEMVLEAGCHFCCFDFGGCGHSDGEVVTLGVEEAREVLAVIECLNSKWKVSQFAVWGRSMGAVAALKAYRCFRQAQGEGRLQGCQFKCMALDSAFISLRELVGQLGGKMLNVPQVIVRGLWGVIGPSIGQRAGFEVDELQIQAEVSRVGCPVMLVASKDDNFIPHEHSQRIYQILSRKAQKQGRNYHRMQYTVGQHHDNRPNSTLRAIIQFIKQHSHSSPSCKFSFKQLRQVQTHRSSQKYQQIKSGIRNSNNSQIEQLNTQANQQEVEISKSPKLKRQNSSKPNSKPIFMGKGFQISSGNMTQHHNIINDKIRKKTREISQVHAAGRPQIKIKQKLQIKMEEESPAPFSCRTRKKVSMTAQQYKNNQLKTLKRPVQSSSVILPLQTKSMSHLPTVNTLRK